MTMSCTPEPIPVNDTLSPVCLESPTFEYYICYGNTGRVSAYSLDDEENPVARRVLENLWSARAVSGRATSDVYGVGGVAFDNGGSMLAVVGVGYINATELAERNPALKDRYASLIRTDDSTFAVAWESEYANNYNEAKTPEANPFGLTIHDGNVYMVDAGGDTLYTYIQASIDRDSVRVEDYMPPPDSVLVIPKVKGISAGRCNGVTPPRGPSFCGSYLNTGGEWLYDTSPVPTAVQVHNGKL